MIKKYLSSLFGSGVALILISFTACDVTGTPPLTEEWRVTGSVGEYMESNYIFDNNNDMIVQGLKFVDGKDTFYLYKINGSGQIRWSAPSTGFGVLKNDNENNIYYIQEVYTLETQSGIKHTLTKYSPD